MPNVQTYLNNEQMRKFRLACTLRNMNETQLLKYIIMKEIQTVKTKNV